jgi:hypothetical protein
LQPSLGGDYITGARPKPNGDGPSIYEQPHEPFHDVCISASADLLAAAEERKRGEMMAADKVNKSFESTVLLYITRAGSGSREK